MSTTIDNKVVEMRFDNSHFEKNVGTTLSTLDKLKKALKLDGLTKGFDNVSSAAKRVDMSGLQNGVETVRARFSALDVVAVTALSNITSAAMRAGKNLVSQFTVDPIMSGLREYETQMNSVQTILANTQSKGTTLDQVNAALAELNTYADKTIYNFSEMTRNIGTFTAAGVELDTAVSSIKGIANLAAVSGSSAQQASTAMYQLSQAIATGRVSLMDWNSVVNAGMGGELFQNALKRTAENFGTNVDAMIQKYGSFRESLTQGGWLTTEVLTETLAQLSGAYSEADLIAQGFSESQAKEIAQMAKTAEDAATKVKTFTQLMDTLREAAGSGWAQTWQLILGDFEEAKEFFTGLSDYFSEMINSSSEARNNLLGDALNSNYEKMLQSFEQIGVSSSEFSAKLDENLKGSGTSVEKLTKKFGSLAKAFQQGKIPADALGKTLDQLKPKFADLSEIDLGLKHGIGFDKFNDDVAEVQKVLVNLGYDLGEVGKKADGVDGSFGKMTENAIKDFQKLNDLEITGIVDEDTLKALDEANDKTKSLWKTIDAVSKDLGKVGGRELLLESFMNVLKAIIEPLKAVKKAFNEVFAIEPEALYEMIEGLHRFTESIVMSDESLDKITRTFKGVFGIFKIFTSLIGGGFSIAFKALTLLLENFDLNLLDVAATVGDVVWAFADFITFGETAEKVFSNLGGIFDDVAGHVSNFFKSITGFDMGAAFAGVGVIRNVPGIKQLVDSFAWMYNQISAYVGKFEGLDFAGAIKKIFADAKKVFTDFINFCKNLTWDDVISGLTSFGEKVREFFSNLKEKFEEIGPDLIEGLQNGLKDGVDKIFEKMKEIGTKIVEAIKAVLGIHSPSTVMFEIGQNIVQGLINGINSLIGGIAEIFRGIGKTITDAIGPVDWGAVGVAIFGVGMFMTLYKLTDALQGFASAAKNVTAPAAGAGKVMTSISELIDGVTGNLKGSTKLQNMAIAVKMFAESIVMLAAAVGALALLDSGKLWNAVGVIAALSVIMGALTIALNKWGTGGQLQTTFNISGLILSLAAAFVMLGVAAKVMGSIDTESFKNAEKVLVAFGIAISALMLVSALAGKNLDKTAAFIGKVGGCFILLGVAAKLMGTIDEAAFENAARMVKVFTLSVTTLVMGTLLAGPNVDKAAKFISKIGMAFLMLAAVSKILGGMTTGEMGNAQTMLSMFTTVVGLLMVTVGLFEPKVDSVSSFLIKIAGAFALLAVAAKIMGSMEPGEMKKAGAAIAMLSVIMAGLVAATNLAPKGEIAKISTTLLGMSLAIGVLAGISVLLSFVKTENLIKGIAAVSALALLVSMMTIATKNAKNVKGTMIGVAIAIGVMAAAIAALSFIDPSKLIPATVAIGALMGIFALIESQSGKGKKAMASIIAMTVAIAAIGGILMLLSGMPVESTLGSAAALSTVLLALTSAMKILHGVGRISNNALVSMGVLTLVMAGIGGILYLLQNMNPESVMPIASGISTVLFAMSAACLILDQVQYISKSALVAMGALTLVVGGIAVILGLMSALDVAPSIETASALSIMLLGMSGAMVILSALGPLAAGAIAAAGSLAAVLGILAGVVLVAGGIKQIPGVDWLVSEGREFLQKIGEAIGKFIGGFVGGALDGLTDNLIGVADNLSNFITHLQPFLDGVSKIDPSVQQSINTLVGMIMSLTAGSFITSVADFLGISTDFGALGEKLVPFGEAMQKYSQAVSGIDAGAVQASAVAGEALSKLAGTLPKSGGLAQAIFGETTDLATFGTQLVAFGEGIKAYSMSVTGIDAGAIQASATAGEALSQLASTLPKEGGLAQAIFGTTEGLDQFGTQLVMFGTGLKWYSMAVTGLAIEPIQQSVAAAQSLNQLAQTLGTEGGLLSLFTGEQKGLDTFGAELAKFGGSLQTYSTSLSGVDFTVIDTATLALNKIKVLAMSLMTMETEGLAAKLTSIEGIGTSIATYSNNLGTFNVEGVNASTNAISSIIASINSMASLDVGGVATFKQAISDLATVDLSGVIAAFNGAAAQALQAGVNFVSNLASGIQNGGGRVIAAATSISNILLAFLTASSAMFIAPGLLIATNVGNGITNGTSVVTAAIVSMMASAKSSADSEASGFSSVGFDIGAGIVSGMNTYITPIANAARALVRAAKQAAEDEAGIASPSKVFRKEIAGYMGMGMVLGLKDYSKPVAKAGKSLARNAIDGVSRAISNLSDMIDPEMDLTPTITPVLDLDNVKSGAASINGMLANTAPVSVLSNVNAINRRMNQFNQNGGNDDVVSAIDKLGKKFKDIGGPSYNINGITYNGDSDVANAIETLIRATRIEGRV